MYPSLARDFCRLLITFANILDPDQDRQNGSGSKPFDNLMLFLKDFFKKLILKKVSRRQQKHEKLPSMQRVNANKGKSTLETQGNKRLTGFT